MAQCIPIMSYFHTTTYAQIIHYWRKQTLPVSLGAVFQIYHCEYLPKYPNKLWESRRDLMEDPLNILENRVIKLLTFIYILNILKSQQESRKYLRVSIQIALPWTVRCKCSALYISLNIFTVQCAAFCIFVQYRVRHILYL